MSRIWTVCAGTAAFLAAVLTAPASAQSDVPHTPLADVVTDTIVLPGTSPGVVDTPQPVAATSNAVWVVSHRGGRIDRIDPKTNQVVASIDVPVPGCTPDGCSGLGGIVADRRNVWVFNNELQQLVHIDAKTNRVVGTIPTARSVESDVVLDGDGVWAALAPTGDVVRIDAKTNKVTDRVHVRDTPVWPLAIVGDDLWVGSHDPAAPPDQASALHRVDRRSGRVEKTVFGVTGSAATLVDGALWLSGCGWLSGPQPESACPTVKQVDARTGALLSELAVGGVAYAASKGGPQRFVATVERSPGTLKWLAVIDTATGRAVAAYDFPATDAPPGLAFADGSLWTTDWTANTVRRVRLPSVDSES